MTSSAWKISIKEPNWLIGIIFLYFLTLSGDLLNVTIGSIEIRLARFLGLFLFFILLLSNRFRLIERKLFLCFLGIFSSFVISSFFSCNFARSTAGCGEGAFAYLCFFLVPLNLMFLFDRTKILRLYFLSFVLVGLHAFVQFLLSFFGIYDPFVTQKAGVTLLARGQSWTYEPSFYALFATPFVAFFNARFLLSSRDDAERLSLWKVLGANLLLLISTSTGGFFSYFVFFITCFLLTLFSFIRQHFAQLRMRIGKFLLCFTAVFCSIGLVFLDMFLHTFYKFFYIGFLTHWSFTHRLEKICDAWEVFCASPLFGMGLRTVEQYFYLKAHFDNADVQLHEKITTRGTLAAYHLSNVFIEVLACLGIYGMCAFIILGIIIWQMFITALKDSRLPKQERKMLFCFFVSVIVMLVCLQFNQGIFRNYVWTHMGISLGYLLNVRSKYLQA